MTDRGTPGSASGGEPDGTVRRRTLAWLEPRLERVPEELAEAIRSAVRRAAADGAARGEAPSRSSAGEYPPWSDAAEGVGGLLARAAAEELDRVLELPQTRATAVRLLAADASLTYAFEAASELGEDVLGLAEAAGARGAVGARLGALGEARETDEAP